MVDVESIVKDVIENDKDRIFKILQRELNLTFTIPNIRFCEEPPEDAPCNIDPKTLELCMVASNEALLGAKKVLAGLGVERSLREVVISEFSYVCGRYVPNLMTDLAYSKYYELRSGKLRDVIIKQDSELIHKFIDEDTNIIGRFEGIAYFGRLKVLEDYKIDKRFEETMYLRAYESSLKDVIEKIRESKAPEKSILLLPSLLKYSAQVIGVYYRELLKTMTKPQIREFVCKKPGDITQEEIKETSAYLDTVMAFPTIFSLDLYED